MAWDLRPVRAFWADRYNENMNMGKASLSLAIVISMLGAAPGLESYRAAAAVLQARVATISSRAGKNFGWAPGAIGSAAGAAGMMELKGLSLAPSLLPRGLTARAQAQEPSQALPRSANIAIVRTPAIHARENAGVIASEAAPGRGAITEHSAIQGLKQELPDFGKMGQAEAKGGAGKDFMGRVGHYQEASSDESAVFAKQGLGRGMPDHTPDRDRTPDPDGSGSDDGVDRTPSRPGGSDPDGSGGSDDGINYPSDGDRDPVLFKSPIAPEGGARSLASLAGSAFAPSPSVPARSAVDNGAVDLIVMFSGTVNPLARDEHLAFVDVRGPDSVRLYAIARQGMLSQIEEAGLESDTMAAYHATPMATYARINAATIRVDAGRAVEFRKLLTDRGFKVYDNARREIIRPVPVDPETMDPSARGPVTMEENLKLSRADLVQVRAQQIWGAPILNRAARFLVKLFIPEIPQPPIGVIDTGADVKHPLLRWLKGVVNATNGPNADDNGHGTWVTSMILNYAPWLKALTHYKTFVDGNATLDDILKALTMAGNDGNIVISNSWGSSDGDPESPDSQLVRKLAEEGHIMVFAAGNSGPNPDTISAPAIVHYKDAKTGAIRVVSVAATDRNKKVAIFSSTGPGSRKTKNIPGYPHRPDLSAVGYNTEGAWPTDRFDSDRVDPVKGPLKAISGTSMSTPAVAGAIALVAMLFGVTAMGEKLDVVVNAVMSTLVKTGQSPDKEGEGFIDVEAAYDALKAVLAPVAPNFIARWALRFAGGGR